MPCALVNFAQSASAASRRSDESVIKIGYGGSFAAGALGEGLAAHALRQRASATSNARRNRSTRHVCFARDSMIDDLKQLRTSCGLLSQVDYTQSKRR